MYSVKEDAAVREKVGQLQMVLDGALSMEELSELIAKRRVGWMRENLPRMMKKYAGLPPEIQAHRIIFLEHMPIDPLNSAVFRLAPGKIRIESYNFCPYLEACEQLGLDTREVCKAVNEQGIQEAVQMINPNLRFRRDYQHIRPSCECCAEYIELDGKKTD